MGDLTFRLAGNLSKAVVNESGNLLPLINELEDKNTFLADLDYHLAAPLLIEMVTFADKGYNPSVAIEIISSFKNTYDYHQLFMEMCSRDNDIPRAAAIIADLQHDIQQKIFLYDDNKSRFTYASIIEKLEYEQAATICKNLDNSLIVAKILSILSVGTAADVINNLEDDYAAKIISEYFFYHKGHIFKYIPDYTCASILDGMLEHHQVLCLEGLNSDKQALILSRYRDTLLANTIRQQLR